MKKSALFVFIMALFMPLFLIGQENLKEEKPYIEVTGTAEKEVIPDQIYISIRIKEKDTGKDKITVEAQENELKSGLKAMGIDLNNLSLADADADYIRVGFRRKVISQKDYTLLVGDAVIVGKVFELLDKLEIEEAQITKVNHSKMDEFKKEVKITAIKAAKAKADYLLTAIGEQTGKALIVRENEPMYSYAEPMARYSNVAMQDQEYKLSESFGGNLEDNSISFKKIKILAEIYVKFEIKH